MTSSARSRLWVLIASAAVVGSVIDVLVDAAVPGRGAAIGFFGCILIVYAAKWLGATAVQRPEDYFDQDTVEETKRV